MISFRSSDRPSVHPSCRRSVSLSLMHVCMSVIFLISNSKFLTSNFDIYSRVCVYACVRECAADVCMHMNSPFVRVFTRLAIFLYLTYMYMFKYFCPPVGLMPCLCVRPSIYLTAYMHAYVGVCASVHSSVHPFVLYASMNVLF